MPIRVTGHYRTTSTVGEAVKAFVPDPLPPDPPLQLDGKLTSALLQASVALGRLDVVSSFLPDKSLFLYHYIRKEAVLSSQIEGTQSSFEDLILYENDAVPSVPIEDVSEVSCYVAALEHGMARIKSGFPLSLRLIQEMHGVLLSSGRGSHKKPGEFRTSQNWIGGSRPGVARHVPPPPEELMNCMGALEKFLHNDPVVTPPLIKAGMAHVQFETIHPFLDGNGRIGRLLIPLIFCVEGILSEPILYVSLFFKQNREAYYDHLQAVRTDGDWEGWLGFYLEAVRTSAEDSITRSKALLEVINRDRTKIEQVPRKAGSMLRVYQIFTRRVAGSVNRVREETGLHFDTIQASLRQFEKMGIVREVTGKQRDRVWVWEEGLRILEGQKNENRSS